MDWQTGGNIIICVGNSMNAPHRQLRHRMSNMNYMTAWGMLIVPAKPKLRQINCSGTPLMVQTDGNHNGYCGEYDIDVWQGPEKAATYIHTNTCTFTSG